jgi:hypothetical protein
MKTYQAGKGPIEAWGGETRGWVFDLLENPRYRERLEVLAGMDLKRRSGCEPCLRALVIDEWSYEALYHLGWCDSCRQASFALGMDGAQGKVAASPHRRRAVWLALAAAAVIAVPVLGTQVLMDDGSQLARGAHAQQVRPATTPSTGPSTTPSTGPSTTPSTGPSTTPGMPTPGTVEPIPRTRPTGGSSAAGRSAVLPKTT